MEIKLDDKQETFFTLLYQNKHWPSLALVQVAFSSHMAELPWTRKKKGSLRKIFFLWQEWRSVSSTFLGSFNRSWLKSD